MYLKSSIISGNGLYNASTPTINSTGYNIFSQATVNGSSGSDQMGVTAGALALGPLAFNGGPTKTRMPLAGSVAINSGSPGDVIDAQNGPIIGIRDVGAAEFDECANDLVAPMPDIGSLAAINAQCSVSSLMAPTATDNCGGTITGTHNATLPITSSTSITWTYNDGNGNTSTQTQSVNISDVTGPVANLGSLANLSDPCSINSLSAPTATDNCAGTITGTHNATLPITSSTSITWTYDDGNGNISTQTQNVVITDNTAPVANVASLSPVSAQCQVTSLTAPSATDNCAGTITGTHNASLPITAQGTTVVTWTYNDGNGNTSTQTQNVVIADNAAPVANVASLAPVSAQCQVTSLTAPSATDNCAGTITGTHNATLPITAQGTTVVTWTYNDGNGNTSTQTQNVVIADNTAPVANVASLATVSAQCQVTSLTAPSATDNCAGTITGTHNASLPITAQGTTVVTWTYNDGNGNTSTQTQNVVIADITAPTADIASLSTITSECSVTSLTPPTALDNCVGSVTGTHNVTLPITAQGTTTVTWTYDDGNGNVSTQTQNVIITPIDNGITQIDALTLSANATGYTYQWIDCDNGNAVISGETGQTFVATANGNYAVEIDNGTCTVTSECILIDHVGIIKTEGAELIKVYPNPTNGVFTISGVDGTTHIEIFNSLGQALQLLPSESSAITIDIAEYSTGVYYIKVKSHSAEIVQKIIKQ
ncbi:MAG: hypothetical protein A3D92_11410 [Bacteroidetes bacterium RIFCSPHIGHO2_02_FULL_44_7]|nr:MAG: hypothetical protein A3D92_11410 [Bacteroidetes bacterium RIFCSPHIGHO2_02_FULL_44_7]